MADLPGVELARPGTYDLSTGPFTVTEKSLRDAADFAALPDARPAPVHLGHVDPRNDGEPAFGWLTNVRVEDDKGPVLKGDVVGMPQWLVSASKDHWPDRSIEGFGSFEYEGRTYDLVVQGLALLGVTPPGMTSIASFRDLPQALGLAASSKTAIPFESLPHAASATHSAPDPGAASQKGAGMDPATREALGIAPDASDTEVDARLASLGLTRAPAEPAPVTPVPAPVAEAPAPAAPTETPVTPPAEVPLAAAALPPEVREQLETQSRELAAIKASAVAESKKRLIDGAIGDGKIKPAERAVWSARYDKAPEVVTEIFAATARGSAVPVAAAGYQGGEEPDPDDDPAFAGLFPPTAEKED